MGDLACDTNLVMQSLQSRTVLFERGQELQGHGLLESEIIG